MTKLLCDHCNAIIDEQNKMFAVKTKDFGYGWQTKDLCSPECIVLYIQSQSKTKMATLN